MDPSGRRQLVSWIWRVIGCACAATALAILVAEHFVSHRIDLNPANHWLSEYVLSGEPLAREWMKAAFVALGGAALSVAILATHALARVFFIPSGLALTAMAFFDTYPNDGRVHTFHWPPTPGNMHQFLLYTAIGATLLGMGMMYRSGSGFRAACFWIATIAVCVQTGLVALQGSTTLLGGVTERVIVVAALAWVANFCLCHRNPQDRRDLRHS